MAIKIPLVPDYIAQIERLPDLNALYRPQTTTSFPIPDQAASNLLHFFTYSSTVLSPKESRVGRPEAHFVVEVPAVTVRQIDEGQSLFAGLGGTFPATVVRDVDLAVVEFQLDAFYSIYEVLLKAYPHPQPGFVLDRFRNLFTFFVPGILMPYYRAMNPHFSEYIGL